MANTLVAETTFGAVGLEMLYGQHGQRFATNVSISGAVQAEFAGVGITLGEIEISGNGLMVGIGSQSFEYSADRLNDLTFILVDQGLSQNTAEALIASLKEVVQFTESLGTAIDELIPENDYGTELVDIFVMSLVNYEYHVEIYHVPLPYQLNENGDLQGSEGDNVFFYNSGGGSIRIYDYTETSETTDVLIFSDITLDEVSFERNASNDLEITIRAEETVTINNQFVDVFGTSNESIEKFVFGGLLGGIELSSQEIAALTVDAKSIVCGSDAGDTLIGRDESEKFYAGSGDDIIFDGAGDDEVFGGEGNDLFNGGVGADLYDGGVGMRDTVSFKNTATTGFSIDLTDTTQSTGFARGDQYVNIDRIIGSKYDDTIIGDDSIAVLNGHNGDDVIVDGSCMNFLKGGNGADIFVFAEADGFQDRIYDFHLQEDRIDLSGLGVTSLDDVAFSRGHGYLILEAAGETIRLDGHTMAHVDRFTDDHFIFA